MLSTVERSDKDGSERGEEHSGAVKVTTHTVIRLLIGALAATASSLDAGMEDHCELTSPPHYLWL